MRDKIERAIEAQYRVNRMRNLFYRGGISNPFLEPAKETLSLIMKEGEALRAFLRETEKRDGFDRLAGRMAEKSCRTFVEQNQYLDFDRAAKKRMKEVYRCYLKEIREACDGEGALGERVADLFKSHTERLVDMLEEINGRGAFQIYRETEALRTLLCAQYTEAFQKSLLGIDADTLMEPVLDIGCGEEGILVKALRRSGIKAVGMDRLKGNAPYLVARNWFDMPLKKHAWGTIVSHMAFSNHFWHHHLRFDGQPDRYGRKYMEILEALKPGGRFVYAPGLPFMEEALEPAVYSVDRREIPSLAARDPRFYVAVVSKKDLETGGGPKASASGKNTDGRLSHG